LRQTTQQQRLTQTRCWRVCPSGSWPHERVGTLRQCCSCNAAAVGAVKCVTCFCLNTSALLGKAGLSHTAG
jgi:hypothetical protein